MTPGEIPALPRTSANPFGPIGIGLPTAPTQDPMAVIPDLANMVPDMPYIPEPVTVTPVFAPAPPAQSLKVAAVGMGDPLPPPPPAPLQILGLPEDGDYAGKRLFVVFVPRWGDDYIEEFDEIAAGIQRVQEFLRHTVSGEIPGHVYAILGTERVKIHPTKLLYEFGVGEKSYRLED